MVKPKRSGVTRAPFDEGGNLMHWAPSPGYGWGQPEQWRDNVPFEAIMTVVSVESGRSAKYLMLTDQGGRRYPMFIADLIEALKAPAGVANGVFGGKCWMVAKRGANYGVRVARDVDYPAD